MIKRTIAVLTVLIMLFGCAGASDALITRAISIISTEESGGNYGCATTDVNGKASLGFMQWNGSRAAALLRGIIASDAQSAVSILGEALYDRLKDAKTCVLSSSERAKVRLLLLTERGKAKQDEKAQNDVSAYVRTARGLGITDLDALCYYCDIVHQVGTGAIVKYHVLASQLAGGYGRITLEHLYRAALQYATHTKARRTRVYEKLLKNPVSGAPADETHNVTLLIRGERKFDMVRYEKIPLEYDLTDSTAHVFWKSSAPGVVRVNKKGVIRAVKRGKAQITAYTATGLSDSIVVRVLKPTA